MELNYKEVSILKPRLVFQSFLFLQSIKYFLFSFYLTPHPVPYLFKRKEKRQTSKIIYFILKLFFFNYSIQGFDYQNKGRKNLIRFDFTVSSKRSFSLKIPRIDQLKILQKFKLYLFKIKKESLGILSRLISEKTQKNTMIILNNFNNLNEIKTISYLYNQTLFEDHSKQIYFIKNFNTKFRA